MHLVLQSALPLICLGHCLPFYQYTGELSQQPCILPSVGFHSSRATIWTHTEQLSSHVGQRADMSAAHKIRRSTEPCLDTPPLRPCCKPQEITDGQILDIKHAMRQVGITLVGARENENEMFRFEANLYLGFQTPWFFLGN